MEKPHLRAALPEDTTAIATMARAMFSEMTSYGGHPISTDFSDWKNLVAETSRTICDANSRCFVAESEDKALLGFVIGIIMTPGFIHRPKKILHISNLYVMPNQRRCGIGQRLLTAIMDWGRQMDCVEVDLNVLHDNPATVLYEKLGFEVFYQNLSRRL